MRYCSHGLLCCGSDAKLNIGERIVIIYNEFGCFEVGSQFCMNIVHLRGLMGYCMDNKLTINRKKKGVFANNCIQYRKKYFVIGKGYYKILF
jgi:hypothetical protein